jgi:hypothetical protein
VAFTRRSRRSRGAGARWLLAEVEGKNDEEEEGGLGHGVGLEGSITGVSGARVQYMKEEGTWATPGERGLA